MAKFYATIKGQAGQATRRGTASSGVRASVQSWKGSLISELSDDNGETKVSLYMADGSSGYGSLIFQGSLEALKAKLAA